MTIDRRDLLLGAGAVGDMRGILARVDALPAAQRDALRSGNAAPRRFDFG